jgi:hypothetical protein
VLIRLKSPALSHLWPALIHSGNTDAQHFRTRCAKPASESIVYAGTAKAAAYIFPATLMHTHSAGHGDARFSHKDSRHVSTQHR